MNKYKCCKEAIVKYYLEGASILSVEQGSIKSNPNNPVIAFTVETEGEKNIKCIVKLNGRNNATMYFKDSEIEKILPFLKNTPYLNRKWDKFTSSNL